MVEQGRIEGQDVIEMAQKYLEGLKQTEIDTLILGCTHFPYLTPVIRLVMGKKVRLIDPAEELAVYLKNECEFNYSRGGVNKYRGKTRGFNNVLQFEFIVSDKKKISNLLWESNFVKNREIPNITEINIFR